MPDETPAPDLEPRGAAGPYCTVCGHTTLHDARTCVGVHLACDACRAGKPVLDDATDRTDDHM